MSRYISIDIGGTFIKYGLLLEDGEILLQEKIRTPKNLADFKKCLQDICQHLSKDIVIEGIAVSCPGKVDSENGIIYFGGSLPYLHEFQMRSYLKTETGLPISVINDGKAAALAEKWKGNLTDTPNGVALVLGTGLGGGIILNYQLLQGSHYQAGEFSFFLPNDEFSDLDHLAGKKYSPVGMIEAVATLLGLPDKKDGKKVFEYINQGDGRALKPFHQFCDYLAQFIYNMQAIIDVERVVIGGGISAQPIVVEEIKNRYNKLISDLPFIGPMLTPVDILPCQFAGDANLIGALYHLLSEKNSSAL
ncbi:ROK family protein [Streptococcus suis]|uniref:ROK family protein n=1 Tax=Streptococcus suis TaxID=1307 RepID=UPI00300FC7EE